MTRHIEEVHAEEASVAGAERSTGELLADLSEQLGRLIHAEVQLATTELRRKSKRAGLGAALFAVAAVAGLIGAGVLVACAILALALVLPAWLAALLVGAAVLIGAGLFAVIGRFALRRATPPMPGWAITSVREDVKTIVKGARTDDRAK
jgi:uncharacterized membrane protein YqjE